MSERWKPEIDDAYYFFDSDFNVTIAHYNGYTWDDDRIAMGNCFNTKDDACDAAEKVKTLLLSLQDNDDDENLQDKIQDMVTNTCQAMDRGKENVAKATCSFGVLPKLTVEVFDRPDCPEWARYAAVSSDGRCLVCREHPIKIGGRRWANPESYWEKSIDGKFDVADWPNSLIERPEKKTLPEWCKVGEWVYYRGYRKIIEVKALRLVLESAHCGNLTVYPEEIGKEVKQARFRPYNADEMKALVGKSITLKDGAVCLCTAWSAQSNHIILDNTSWTAESLLDIGYTVDGKPCGKLEHLNEKGEWVE
jgi:hypothetical protein